jgi:hypothetical protein
MMLQLNPPLPMDTPKGIADAHFVIDYGSEGHILFVTFVRCSGECWTWQARECQLEKNVTGGIRSCAECENKQTMIDNLEEVVEERTGYRDAASARADRLQQQLTEARQAVAVLKRREAQGPPLADLPSPKFGIGDEVLLDDDHMTCYVIDGINPDGTYRVRKDEGDLWESAVRESRLKANLPF